jgi:hypothetical protein
MADIIPVTYEVFSCGTSRALALRMVRGIFSFPTYSGLLWLIPSSHRHSLLHIRGHVSTPEGGFRIPDPPLTQSRGLGRHSRREIPGHVKAAKLFVAQSFALAQPYVVLRLGVGLACKDWFRAFF